MDVDLTEKTPLETGPLDLVEAADLVPLAPLALARAAEGTRSRIAAAPPPIPARARRATTVPPPIPTRAARGTDAPSPAKLSLVPPRASAEMMASWQINPERPPEPPKPPEPLESPEPVAKVAPPVPLLFATSAPVPVLLASAPSPLPTTLELVRAADLPARAVSIATETASVTVSGNAPSEPTTSSTALPIVQQDIIPSPRESRVAPLPTSQPGADVADLPVWPVALTLPFARPSSSALPPPVTTRPSNSKLPLPTRGRGTLPPPLPGHAAPPIAATTPSAGPPTSSHVALPRVPTVATPSVVVDPSQISALDGSDGWVFEDAYEERHVDGEVVPTTYFARTALVRLRPRSVIVAGAAVAAIVAIGLAAHSPTSTSTTRPPAVAQPVVTHAPAAPINAPHMATPPSAPTLTTLPITSWPTGAVVTLVDNGTAIVLGPTPISAALDPAHSYDVVLAVPGRPTMMKHVDLATMHELAVDLDPDPAVAKPAVTKPAIAKPAMVAKPVSVAIAKPATAKAPVPASAAQPAKVKSVAGPVGTLMVSAKPPCEIVIDGKSTRLMTPQRSITLSPGTHTVTLVNATLNIKKTIAVHVDAKQATKLIRDFTK